MNTRLTARSCRGIASRLALPKKRSLRPKLPSSQAPTAVDGMGVDGVDAGLQSSTSAVFSRLPFVLFFFLTQQRATASPTAVFQLVPSPDAHPSLPHT